MELLVILLSGNDTSGHRCVSEDFDADQLKDLLYGWEVPHPRQGLHPKFMEKKDLNAKIISVIQPVGSKIFEERGFNSLPRELKSKTIVTDGFP